MIDVNVNVIENRSSVNLQMTNYILWPIKTDL